MLYLFSSVAIFVSVLVWLHFYLRDVSKVNSIQDVPGPRPWPVLGNLFELFMPPENLFVQIRKWALQYDGVYKVWIFQDTTLGIYKPQYVEALLSNIKYIQKGVIYSFLHPWLNDGLLTSSGEKWHRRRKILTPSFHFNILQQFVAIFGEHADNMVADVRSHCGEAETNVKPIIAEVTLNNICETAMGTNLQSYGVKGSSKYKNNIYRMGELIFYRAMRPWLHPRIVYDAVETGKEQSLILKQLHTFTEDVIEKRKLNFCTVHNDDTKQEETFGKKRLAMLDVLLTAAANDNNIDDLGIREEVDTFMFEGHDTTSMALTFAMMCLANNPEVQQKVFDECFAVFGDTKTHPSIQQLQQLKYTEMFIKETLRLYPSVPLISRVLRDPIQLGPHMIPPGISINVHIFDLHRDPTFYPDPERFDPDRFLPEISSLRHPYSYIPFSAGPRNCIGQKFAMLELKSVVSSISRNFILKPITRPEDVVFQCDIVLRTSTPIKVQFIAR